MADIKHFPDGYEVLVCKRQDILDCLDENVIDKELVMDVISDCELQLAEYVKNGVWAGLPFIGSFKWSEEKKIHDAPETQELINTAKETLSNNEYKAFRAKLGADICNATKKERLRGVMTAQYRKRNKLYWRQIANRPQLANCIDKEVVVRFICGTFMDIEPMYDTTMNSYED